MYYYNSALTIVISEKKNQLAVTRWLFVIILSGSGMLEERRDFLPYAHCWNRLVRKQCLCRGKQVGPASFVLFLYANECLVFSLYCIIVFIALFHLGMIMVKYGSIAHGI